MSKTIRIVARTTDLWSESEGGYSENGACVRQIEIEIPENSSDLAIARRVKKELGIEGWKTDSWCGADFCWRSGLMGAYADIVS